MKVLVIGGSGFIGRRLVARLADAGHQPVVFDLVLPAVADPLSLPGSDAGPATAVQGDVGDVAALVAAGRGCELVVNLAAEHRDDVRPVSRYDRVNVDGARAVCAAAAELGIRQLLFTSSVAVYGLDAGRPDEHAPPAPFNDYGRTKLAAEAVYRNWAAADPGRGLLLVRPCVVFGEANRGNVYNLIAAIAHGRFLRVGDGSNRKSMAYVGNLVDYLVGALPVSPGVRLRNYADQPDLTTRELIVIVEGSLGRRRVALPSIPLRLGLAAGSVLDVAARLTRRTFPVSRIRIQKFAADTRIDASAVLADGYTAPTPLPDALRRTIAAEFPAGVGTPRP